MSFTLPYTPTSLTSSSSIFSSVPALRRRQVARVNAYNNGERFDSKQNRQYRKALYKSKLAIQKLSQFRGARESYQTNPLQDGLPRAFKILLAGREIVEASQAYDEEQYIDDGQAIFFSSFGVPGKPVKLNHYWIPAEDIQLSPNRLVYTINTKDEAGTAVTLHLNFADNQSTLVGKGSITQGDGMWLLGLQPWAVKFNVNVAVDCGAYKSTGLQTFQWDPKSPDWINAHWQSNNMIFSYNTVPGPPNPDPEQPPYNINEASFTDSLDPENPFALTKADYLAGKYVTIMDGTIDPTAVYMSTTVTDATDVPTPLATRSSLSVSSVYPIEALWKFDNSGASFTGAYAIPQSTKVFGTVGEVIFPPFIGQPVAQGDHMFASRVAPVKIPGAPKSGLSVDGSTDPAKPLTVTGLTNMDPMVPTTPDKSATGWVDIVAEEANQDFNDIICYYMDESIRKTFVQNAPIVLKDPQVKAIADDSPNNSSFYKTLQVPYVVSSLSRSTLPEAGQCNAERAGKKLKDLPAGSPVYKRHSDLLYRNRYLKHFTDFQLYLNDQKEKDYTSNIKNMVAYMKEQMKEQTKGANGPDGEKLLKEAEKDIEDLGNWAIERQLYWAMQLYFWCQSVYMPMLYAQSTNGKLSPTISKELKKYTATLGMLEESAQNENGQTFQQAFNAMVQNFQMGALIPQLVDAGGNASDIDDLSKRMLWQFYEDNINSSDPKIVEQAVLSKQLAQEDFLRQNFFNSLNMSMRMAGTFGTWSTIVRQFVEINQRSKFYRGLVNGAELGSTTLKVFSVAFLVLPMLNEFGGWSAMTPAEQTGWVVTAAAIALTFTIKLIQGVIRMNSFWQGWGAISHNLKAFFGFEKYLSRLGSAANNVQNAFAKWFVRTGSEAMALEGRAVSVGMKIFGRSAGQFLANTVAVVLAAVNIVLSVISAVNSDDPLQKAMDSMMIIASALQLLAIGAAWLVSAGLVTSLGGVWICGMVATWAGPLAILFVVVGIIIMIVMACLKKDPPNPVQQFMDDYAQPAGLKMNLGLDIDYFNVVPADSKSQSLNGISFEVPVQDGGNQTKVYLQCGPETAAKSEIFNIIPATDITYEPDTCWCVQSNLNGLANIFTYVLNSEKKRQAVCLTELKDGSIAATLPPAKTMKDPQTGKIIPVPADVYNAELARQRWNMAITWAGPRTERDVDGQKEMFGDAASFKIGRDNKYLVWTKVENSWKLELAANASHEFTMRMQPIGPAVFTYIQEEWEINTLSKDEKNGVLFQGPTSKPLEWSVSPALPYFLELVGSGPNTGTIQQVAGITPELMAKKIYTVQASITIVGNVMKQKTDVTIGVEQAPDLNAPVEDSSTHHPPPSFIKAPITRGVLHPSDVSHQVAATSAPDFFTWTQVDQIALNLHFTAQAAISRMQQSVPGQWSAPADIFGYGKIPYEQIFYANPPSPSATPPLNANDHLDYAGAVSAFVAQAIANGDGEAQPYCNWNKAQGTIDGFNSGLYNNNYYNYLAWLQWNGSTSITGTHYSLQDYISALTSPAYVSLMAALQAQGRWPTASIDMFLHFLKMIAIGATDDQVKSTYNQLCYPSSGPKLDPSGFPSITPETWKTYRGYISNTGISTSQLNVTGFGRYYMKYYAGGGGGMGYYITFYADQDFLRDSSYWQPKPSNCCFEQSTSVVLADGISTKPIGSIQPGDEVLSPTPEDGKASATVVFVSRPLQMGRCLYHLTGQPTLAFTATHPVLMGYDTNKLPILGFADVDAALAGNPLWAAFTVKAIPPADLTQVPNPHESDDVVFADLILAPKHAKESSSPVPQFVIIDAQGQRLNVCSEAPDVNALPLVTRFLIGFAESIAAAEDRERFFPEGLAVGALDYRACIRQVRALCAHEASRQSVPTSTETPFTMAAILQLLEHRNLPVQVILDSLEAVIGSLGLSIQSELDNAWRYVPSWSESPTNTKQVPILSIHFIQLRTDVLDDPLGAAIQNHAANLDVSVSKYNVPLAGPDTLLVRRVLGAKLFHLDAAVILRTTETQIFEIAEPLTIRIRAGSDMVMVAHGRVEGDVSAKWALHCPQARGFEHVGFVYVSGGMATVESYTRKEASYSQNEGFPDMYAAGLGRAVGEDIRKSVVGAEA